MECAAGRDLKYIPDTGAVTLSLTSVATALDVSPSGLRSLMASAPDFPARLLIGAREHVLAKDLDNWIGRRVSEGGKVRRKAA